MRLSHIAALLAFTASTAQAVSLPNTDVLNFKSHVGVVEKRNILAPENALEKRKGGGGGGKGGGSSSGGKSGSSSSGSSSSSSSSSRTGSSSTLGGSTKAGSGPTRAYGGGSYYGGGAAVPYQAGQKSSGKGLLAGAAVGVGAAALIMPGLWLYSVYPYYYHNPYRFYNESARNSSNPNGANQTMPVTCLCQDKSPCGCDENDDQTYIKSLVGNGSYDGLNKSLITVADVNNTGSQSLVINGTLPNGTTAPGGEDDAGVALAVQFGGYWAMGLIVVYMVAFI